ncbi:MAG: hypothetical protein BroJett030_02350 [Alphaproteobacteria bacterium]|nr:MAG: hypothetical protein BroJett030_02350 [Alphaproteobacteria bacterium]
MKRAPEQIDQLNAAIDAALAGRRLDLWGRRFLADMRDRFARYGTGTRLSDKQAAKLRELTGMRYDRRPATPATVIAIGPRRVSRRVALAVGEAEITDLRKSTTERRRRHGMGVRIPWGGLLALAIVAGVVGFAIGPPKAGCRIKGNINLTSGERIYHMPGQRYYDVTKINRLNGERWFCSEKAARDAGWRRSRI